MAHTLVFSSETANDINFTCIICGEVIGFNKPTVGSPSPSLVNGVWVPPSTPDEWMNATTLCL